MGLLGKIGTGITDFSDSLSKSLTDPQMQQALALLAAGRPQTTPVNQGGNIGPALQQLMTQQAQRGALNASAVRNLSASGAGANPLSGNVQTTFKGANGNMWVVTRGGQANDLGVPFNENLELIELEDGTKQWFDKSSGQPVGAPIQTAEDVSEAKTAEETRKAVTAAETEAAIELPSALAGIDAQLRKVDDTIATTRDALDQVNAGTAGFLGSLTADIPGSPAFDLRANIKTIQANLGFDQLQQMRAASKTGGALGQVSERELDLLVSAVNSLDPKQSDDQLIDNFNKVLTHYDNYKREIGIMRNAMLQEAGQPVEQNKSNVIRFDAQGNRIG